MDHDAEAQARLPEEFSRSWQPSEFPEGMLRAYELYSPDGNEVVGISVWDSIESRDRYRLSEVESERRRAMAPFVLEEVSGFYVGRELRYPSRLICARPRAIPAAAWASSAAARASPARLVLSRPAARSARAETSSACRAISSGCGRSRRGSLRSDPP